MGYSAYAPKASGLAHVPLTGAEVNAILAVNCNGNMTDLAGDAVFDYTAIAYPADYDLLGSYDGLRDVKTLNGLIGTTTAADHRIPPATAVTYGGFFRFNYVQTATPFPLYSGVAVATNYAFRINPGNGGQLGVRPGGPTFGVEPTFEGWTHVMITETAGRGSATLYVNGRAVATVTKDTVGTQSAIDTFWIGSAVSITNTPTQGVAESIFVADAEYTAAQVRTLAENAFGHALPL